MLWKRLGKEELIYLNQDDDNQDDVPDKDIATTITLNENDLALIFPGRERLETTGTLTLECPGNAVRFWDSSTKGTSPRALPLTWVVDGSENDLPCLYIEGINPGKAEITLTAKDPAGKVMGRDRVKVGVVGIAFTSNANTAFGYDNGTVDDNPTTAALSRFNPPQKYDWVNVSQTENNVTTPTFVTATITPASLAGYVCFKSQDEAVFTVSPSQASGASQELTITGKNAGTSLLTSRICVVDEVYGASLGCLNVAVYPRVVLNDTPFHTIRQSGLVPTPLSVAQLQTNTNNYLKQGVAAVVLDDAGATSVTYDLILNGTLPNTTNGRLDIDNTSAGGVEWQAVTAALGSPTGLTVLYVRDALRHQRPDGQWSDAVGMRKGNYVVLTDFDPRYHATLSHELLHYCLLTDTGPKDKNTRNIMYYTTSGVEEFVGYFVVEKVVTSTGDPFTPRQFEHQWEVLHP